LLIVNERLERAVSGRLLDAGPKTTAEQLANE